MGSAIYLSSMERLFDMRPEEVQGTNVFYAGLQPPSSKSRGYGRCSTRRAKTLARKMRGHTGSYVTNGGRVIFIGEVGRM